MSEFTPLDVLEIGLPLIAIFLSILALVEARSIAQIERQFQFLDRNRVSLETLCLRVAETQNEFPMPGPGSPPEKLTKMYADRWKEYGPLFLAYKHVLPKEFVKCMTEHMESMSQLQYVSYGNIEDDEASENLVDAYNTAVGNMERGSRDALADVVVRLSKLVPSRNR